MVARNLFRVKEGGAPLLIYHRSTLVHISPQFLTPGITWPPSMRRLEREASRPREGQPCSARRRSAGDPHKATDTWRIGHLMWQRNVWNDDWNVLNHVEACWTIGLRGLRGPHHCWNEIQYCFPALEHCWIMFQLKSHDNILQNSSLSIVCGGYAALQLRLYVLNRVDIYMYTLGSNTHGHT